MKENRVTPVHPEIDVPSRNNNSELHTINSNEKPELNRENFARLCKEVTEIREKRKNLISKIEGEIRAIEKTVENIDKRLSDIESDLDVDEIRNIRGDIEDVARVISTIKTEAADFRPDLESDVPF
jgi:DNA-binding FrmR family transcriptional regulator